MRTWHPASWSKQARHLANHIFEQMLYYRYEFVPSEDEYFNEEAKEYATPEYWVNWLVGYRHPLIATRAAKRLGRLCRKAGIN